MARNTEQRLRALEEDAHERSPALVALAKMNGVTYEEQLEIEANRPPPPEPTAEEWRRSANPTMAHFLAAVRGRREANKEHTNG